MRQDNNRLLQYLIPVVGILAIVCICIFAPSTQNDDSRGPAGSVAMSVVRGVALDNVGRVMRGYTMIVRDIHGVNVDPSNRSALQNIREVARQEIADNGRFEFYLRPGRYIIHSFGPPHWYYVKVLEVKAGDVLELKSEFIYSGPPDH